jgi:transposase-like protein
MSRIPHDAIGADQTKHADHNSYNPKFWYVDQRFRCVDCGTSELWTAEAQRWWFEVAKGPIYSEAIRCSACRKAWQEQPGRVSHAKRQERMQNK